MAAEEVVKSGMSRQSRIRLIAGVVIIVLIAVGLWWWHSRGRESTDDAEIDGHIAPIAARVGGTIIAIDVLDNQEVQKGERLAQLDPRDYQIAVRRAAAALATAEANARAYSLSVPITSTTTSSDVSTAGAAVQASSSGITAAENDVIAARARLAAAEAHQRQTEADAIKAQKDLDRLTGLVAKDEISRQQYDAAVADAAARKAAHDASVADVAAARAAVTVAQSQIIQAKTALVRARAELRAARSSTGQVVMDQARAAAAEASVKQARAALAQAELNLAHTTVIAPIHGVVSKKTAEVGQTVQAGQPLLAIVPLDDVWVIANFKETQLDQMRPGQPAIFSVDALDGRQFRGRVQSIAAATGAKFSLLPPENATGNYVKVVQRIPVKIVLNEGEDPHHLLRPGMSVEPTVFTNR